AQYGLTDQLAEKSKYTDELEGRLVAQQDNLHQLEDQIRQVEESNHRLSAAKAESDTALCGLTEQLAEKTKYTDELEGRLVAQQDSLGQFHSEIYRLQEARAVLTTEKADHQQAVFSLTQQLNEKAKCIEDLDNRITAQRADLQNLRDQIRQFGEWNGVLEEERVRLQNQIESLECVRDEIARRFTQAEVSIRERNIVIESKDVVVRELGERFAELSS